MSRYCLSLLAGLVFMSGTVWAPPADRALIEAVKAADVSAIRDLIEQRDPNTTENDGATALHWAAYLDDIEVASLLVDAGADAEVANDLGVTPLALACANANPAMVTLLLQAGGDPTAAVQTGETVLMGCVRTGNPDAVRALVVAGSDVNAREPVEQQTALMWAVAQGHADVVGVLLDQGADISARSRVRRQVISRRLQSELKYGELGRSYGTDAEETSIGGFTPHLFAARQGDVGIARLLLDAGADVHDVAPDGNSALVVATHSGNGELATLLLERGARPNASAGGYTALHAAVLTGQRELVEALLHHGASPHAQVALATKVTRNGQVLMLGEHLVGATALALAAKYAEVELMRVLFKAGSDVHLPLKNGWTPLMLAAGASWRYAVWDRRDRALAKSPAFQAQMFDEVRTLDTVKLLLEHGADVKAVDESGNTALHHVVNKGFDRVVELLAERGADLAAINDRGQTPLAIVMRGRSGNVNAAPKTAELLRTLGAQ